MLNVPQPLNFVLFARGFVASSYSVIDFFLVFKKSIYTKYQSLLSQKYFFEGTLFVHPNYMSPKSRYCCPNRPKIPPEISLRMSFY